ncbi:MAG: DUF7716 domain-containing protein [Betaproteobacteria bacterium]
MQLREIARNLETSDDTLCIVAKRPWSTASDAQLVRLTDECRIPQSIADAGYEYFLEVSVALEDVLGDIGPKLTEDQRLQALIYYAENDAYPEWLCALRDEESQT